MPVTTPSKAPPDKLREALLLPPGQVDLESIAQNFVKFAGGAEAMGKMLFDEYGFAGPGTATRARIMDMVLRAFTKLDGRYAPADLSGLSDEDLHKALTRQLAKMGAIDGNPGHAGPAAGSRAGEAANPQQPEEEGRLGLGPGPANGHSPEVP